MIRFKKIKITSDEKIQLDYEKKNGPHWDEHSMKSNQEAVPEFYHALDNLAAHVEQICELPGGDHTAYPYTIKGVSFSYSGEADVMGATITATRKLRYSNSPLVLNTPHKISEPYNDGTDEDQLLSDDCIIDLQILVERAKEYLNGKRAQGDLFEDDAAEIIPINQ